MHICIIDDYAECLEYLRVGHLAEEKKNKEKQKLTARTAASIIYQTCPSLGVVIASTCVSGLLCCSSPCAPSLVFIWLHDADLLLLPSLLLPHNTL